MVKLNKTKIHWIISVLALLLALLAYSKISYGEIAITNLRVGTYSSEFLVTVSGTNTNSKVISVHGGLFRANTIPLKYSCVVLTNYRAASGDGNADCGIKMITSTNFKFWKAPAGTLPPTYMLIHIDLWKPHNSIK